MRRPLADPEFEPQRDEKPSLVINLRLNKVHNRHSGPWFFSWRRHRVVLGVCNALCFYLGIG